MHGILGAHLQDEVQLLLGDNAVGIVDIAVGAGEVGDLGAQLRGLLHDAPAHVAVAGNGDALALDGVILVLQHFLQVVHSAVAGGLGTDQGAAVAQALTGEDAVLPHALQAAVLAVQVADLAAAHAHVTGGNVDVRPDVAIQSGHEALAETHDLGVGLAGGIEVGTALGAADGQAGQAVLEGLLKAEELDDAFVHVLLEAQAALVGADRAVELAAPAAVGVPLTVIIAPHNAEGEHTLGLDHTAQQVDLLILGVLFDHRLQRGQNFLDGLHELGLVAMLGLDALEHACQISIHIKFLLKNVPQTYEMCATQTTHILPMLIITPFGRFLKRVSENSPLAKPQNFFVPFCAIWRIVPRVPLCRKRPRFVAFPCCFCVLRYFKAPFAFPCEIGGTFKSCRWGYRRCPFPFRWRVSGDSSPCRCPYPHRHGRRPFCP